MMSNDAYSSVKTPLPVVLVDENYKPPFRHNGGNGGGDMEARIAKLESDSEHIKLTMKDIKDDVREVKRDARADFRIIFGAIIATALGLATIMAKGFHWL